MDANETNAIRKLLREPFAYSGPKYPSTAEELRKRAADETDEALRKAKLDRATELDAERIEGEIWPLTFRERCSVDLLMAEAALVADEDGSSQRIRDGFLHALTLRVFARACLRVPGTKGKVCVLTHEQAQELDLGAAGDIYAKFVDAFVLTENERPKAPPLPS